MIKCIMENCYRCQYNNASGLHICLETLEEVDEDTICFEDVD